MTLLRWTLIVVVVLATTFAAGHALLNKRDPKAAWGWIAVCLISPLVGPLLYLLVGINRIHTRALKLDRHRSLSSNTAFERTEEEEQVTMHSVPTEFSELARISDAVTRRPLVHGNRIETLHNGEQAYPAMLEAIEEAERSLFLATYIFETNRTGRQFIDGLARAVARGVDVRVILDGIGELYSIPRAGKLLKKQGVRVARFLPPRLIPPAVHLNLRNHRKILVADGRIGFTGGMNIGDRHLAEVSDNLSRVVDVHFRVSGPVVHYMERVFLEDWDFVTRGQSSYQPNPTQTEGTAICRTIVDGPNEDIDSLGAILVGAISSARQSVSIMTPYVLPTREMIASLQAAALRGVEVAVILPSKNNLRWVHWATRNMLWEVLQRGVRVYYQPPPFVHSKLFIVDDHYAQIGSPNIDPRSLRLNFELSLEVYDKKFAEVLRAHMDEVRSRSREISLEEVDSRPLPVRLRDALAWLFSPYL